MTISQIESTRGKRKGHAGKSAAEGQSDSPPHGEMPLTRTDLEDLEGAREDASPVSFERDDIQGSIEALDGALLTMLDLLFTNKNACAGTLIALERVHEVSFWLRLNTPRRGEFRLSRDLCEELGWVAQSASAASNDGPEASLG